jgi:hypothetical protein
MGEGEMPKERIEGRWTENSNFTLDAAVQWGRDDEEVMLGIVFEPRIKPGPQTLWEYLQTWSDAEKEALNSLWFAIHSRRQVNELIQKLRRARDQAFGRDE